MNRFVFLAFAWIASASVLSQEPTSAAQIAAQRDAEERERRMTATLEELRRANSVQQVRIGELRDEIAALRRQFIELENRFKNSQIGAVTSQDVRKVYDKMAEMERARDADKKLILDQMAEIKKIASQPPVVITQAPPPRIEPRPQPKIETPPQAEPDPQEFVGEYYPYKIQKGDTLLGIIAAYNAQFKEKGKPTITLEQVRKANPKLNPNSLMVGKEIRIPEPSEK